MKPLNFIAIISDTHDNVSNIKKFLDAIDLLNIKEIIHCGDVLSEETIKFLSEKFKGIIHLVCGNGDYHYWQASDINKYKNIKYYGEWGNIILNNKKCGFTHLPKKAEEISQKGDYDFIFYGHTHAPFEKQIRKIKMINPGNLANIYYPATYALYDFNEKIFRLKKLD